MSYDHFRVFWVFRGLKIFVRFVGPGKNRRFQETGGKKGIFEEKSGRIAPPARAGILIQMFLPS